MSGNAKALGNMLEKAGEDRAKMLANLVMTGGARPLHMCGMSRGGDASQLIEVLIRYGADVNAKDNYELTPWDRLHDTTAGKLVLEHHGGMPGHMLPPGVPDWTEEEYAYTGGLPGGVKYVHKSTRQRRRFFQATRYCIYCTVPGITKAIINLPFNGYFSAMARQVKKVSIVQYSTVP